MGAQTQQVATPSRAGSGGVEIGFSGPSPKVQELRARALDGDRHAWWWELLLFLRPLQLLRD